jgi:hypothetical protein
MISGPNRSQEIRSFLMNYHDGKLIPYTQNSIEELLQRDKELYIEFSKLKRRQRKDQTARFIRKYNERNPIYFLN